MRSKKSSSWARNTLDLIRSVSSIYDFDFIESIFEVRTIIKNFEIFDFTVLIDGFKPPLFPLLVVPYEFLFVARWVCNPDVVSAIILTAVNILIVLEHYFGDLVSTTLIPYWWSWCDRNDRSDLWRFWLLWLFHRSSTKICDQNCCISDPILETLRNLHYDKFPIY